MIDRITLIPRSGYPEGPEGTLFQIEQDPCGPFATAATHGMKLIDLLSRTLSLPCVLQDSRRSDGPDARATVMRPFSWPATFLLKMLRPLIRKFESSA